MAVVRSTEDIPAVTESSLGMACSLCEQEMVDLGNCVLTKCKHTFHRECVVKWLLSSKECPNCRKLCHEKDLVQVSSKPVVKAKATYIRGRGRGSAAKTYQTRSSNRLANENNSVAPNVEGVSLEANENTENSQQEGNTSANDSQQQHNTTHNTTFLSIRGRRINRQNQRMTQLIESTVHRMLTEMNVSPWQPQIQSQPTPDQLREQLPLETQHQPPPHLPPPNLAWNSPQLSEQHPGQSTSADNVFNRIRLHPDKVTTIIQSWNVKFEGSSDGLHCEEFLYRIKCLVEETFNGNFDDSVGKNLHVLLTGKAKTWYWRYRKTVPRIVWESFCTELKKQYRDYRTTYDIREELHNRKQKPGESFETFYDAIHSIIDHLAIPLDEEEIIEIVVRNLRPEIRHELLYVQVRSIGHLKKLCQKREKLLNEESFRRSHTNRYPTTGQQRRVAAIEHNDIYPESNIDFVDANVVDNTEFEINAIESQPIRQVKCWNCEEEGHFWDMCLKDRKIFCYGCGLRNVYKPQCPKCSKNSKNSQAMYNNRSDQK